LQTGGETIAYTFDDLPHVQQPMIQAAVEYFSGLRDENPCSGFDGAEAMRLIDIFTGKAS
jgi:hypothetical protein